MAITDSISSPGRPAGASRAAPFPVPEVIFRSSPLFWLGIFALGMPWLRIGLGGWVFYPGHLAGGMLAAGVLLTESGWRRAGAALLPLLALGAYMAGLAAYRAQWETALLIAGSTCIQYLWGAAAFKLGCRERTPSAIGESLHLLLGAVLLAGLLAWGIQAFWPAGCSALNCSAQALLPPVFTGGWASSGQYLVFLLTISPVVGASVLEAMGSPGHGIRSGTFGGKGAGGELLPVWLAGAAGIGLVAGGGLWSLLLVALGLAGIAWNGPFGSGRDARHAVRGLIFFMAFAMVFVYGLAPGYLSRLVSGVSTQGAMRITLAGQPGRILSSTRDTLFSLRLANTGWSELGGGGAQVLWLGARLTITPERGLSRTHDLKAVEIPGPIEAGETIVVEIPLRLPHWVKEGYLSWWLKDSTGNYDNQAGQTLEWAEGSDSGFRFLNGEYRRLTRETENRLSSLAERARAYRDRTRPTGGARPNPDSAVMILGDLLDTLFFSPLWGEPGGDEHGGGNQRGNEPGGPPFAASRPMALALFHRYGLLGLLLAGWVLWRLVNRTLRVAQRLGSAGGAGWRLAPLSIALLGVAGLFLPDLGSYHGHWALFLLAGWMEGRHARLYPAHVPGERFGGRMRFRLRLPWRAGTSRRRQY